MNTIEKKSNAVPETIGKSRLTRAKILKAAARQFRDEGYYSTTMRKIANVAEMEAGSVYYHFGSKDDILDEVLDIGVRQVMLAVQAARDENQPDGDQFEKTLARMVDAHLKCFLKESDFTSSNIRNFSKLSAEKRAQHRPLREEYTALWDQVFEKAQLSGQIRSDISIVPLRQFVLGAMNWTVEWYDHDRYPIEMLSERLTKLLLKGIFTSRNKIPPPRPLSTEQISDVIKADDNKASRTRYQILLTAAKIFRRQGFKAATTRDIAKAAKMQAGSIYYHFASKDEILDEILDLGLRVLVRGVTRSADWDHKYANHRERVAVAIQTHLEYLFYLSEFTSANIRLYGQLPKEFRKRHAPVRHEYARVWDAILLDAQEAGELRSDIKIVPLRQVMLGALNWTVEWFDPAKSGEKDYYSLHELIAMLQTLLFDGLLHGTKDN